MLFRKLAAPKEDNVYQLQLYMHYFDIKKGILLYVDKDQQEMKEFFVDYDEVLCKSLLDKFYLLRDQIDSNIIPARLADFPKNWQCNYCQFKDICKLAKKETESWEEFKKTIETQTT